MSSSVTRYDKIALGMQEQAPEHVPGAADLVSCYFVTSKHVVVTFILEGIQAVRLDDFNHQNVISGLSLEEVATGYRLTLHPCFGAEGTIEAERVRIAIQPGAPPTV